MSSEQPKTLRDLAKEKWDSMSPLFPEVTFDQIAAEIDRNKQFLATVLAPENIGELTDALASLGLGIYTDDISRAHRKEDQNGKYQGPVDFLFCAPFEEIKQSIVDPIRFETARLIFKILMNPIFGLSKPPIHLV